MRPEAMTPDLILDGVGYRLEQRAELGAWLLMRPYRGVAFPDLARTRARFVEAAPVQTLRQETDHQLTFDWHMGMRREGRPLNWAPSADAVAGDTPCHET